MGKAKWPTLQLVTYKLVVQRTRKTLGLSQGNYFRHIAQHFKKFALTTLYLVVAAR